MLIKFENIHVTSHPESILKNQQFIITSIFEFRIIK